MLRLLNLPLRHRLILLAVAVTMTTGIATSFAAYAFVWKAEVRAANQRLGAAARLHSDQLRAAFDLLHSDALAIAAMPPVPGILRTRQSLDGTDPGERSDFALWQRRLEQIFTAILGTRPAYTQLRYIGREDNWQELVRVNKTAGGMVPIRGTALQAKGGEPYLRHADILATGQALMSQVTYNREHGQIDGPPTLRLVQPVLDGQGNLFGAIVINLDFAALLRSARFDPPDGTRLEVLTGAGDHMSFGHAGALGGLQFTGDPGWTPSPFAALVDAGVGGDDLATAASETFRSHPVIQSRPESPLSISLVVSTPTVTLRAAASAALLRTAVIAAVLVVLAGIFAALVAARLPLARLAAAIRSQDFIDLGSLPDDETRALARTFTEMSRDLARKTLQSRLILESVPDGIVTIDAEGRIESVNPAMTQLFLHSAEDLIGARVEMLMPEEFAMQHDGYVQAASDGTGPRVMAANRDIHGLRRDGSTVPLEISVTRLDHGEGRGYVGVIRDISERKRAEAETAALVAALRLSNEELDKFAYVASHDLKAPLRVIDNVSAWLVDDLDPVLTDDTRESLQMLRSRVRRMERLLDDLLTHSRIGRAEERAVRITGAALAETLRDLVDLPPGMTLEIGEAFAEIEIANMPITTILLNLIGNAIKHHDRPDGTVRLDVQDTGAGYRFTVIDDGPGIPPQYHARIFEMFQTLRPRDEVDGSGLGLAMVRKYAEIAGGSVTVASDGARGACFTLFWPHEARTWPTPDLAA